ncbi:uncharacterized protein LOC120076150 [Benincasa hispida]|uniref:uncharacterized protein LOC120076150 n=1 Tax=Benincasa hispida TaxID=102211 RepID=UPI0018FFB70C|nr:uncharacterized protein LOC120076150 [Benincasa hispida]
MTSAVISLLETAKLNVDNYVQWKNIINTILMINDLKFVLLEECPPTPGPTASRIVREVYDRWTKANEKTKVYILPSLSKVLAKKHEVMVSAWKVMDSLRGLFGQPATHLRNDVLNSIFNARMPKGASVREHVFDMMVHFNVVEMNDVVIDEASQISFILETPLKSYL